MPKNSKSKSRKKFPWRLNVDARVFLCLLGLSNLCFVCFRGCHLRSVDSGIETRIKSSVSHDLIARFDAWVVSTSNNVAFVSAQRSDDVPIIDPTKYVECDWGYSRAGNEFYVVADGVRLGVGDVTEYGEILSIGRRVVRCSNANVVLRPKSGLVQGGNL